MTQDTRPARRLRPPIDGPNAPLLPRGEFLDMFAEQYESGQHVSLIGPTQRGKTTLTHQMLAQTASPERKVHMMAGKPPHRDPVMNKAAERLNLRLVHSWPPPYDLRDGMLKKYNGYVVRPKQGMTDLKADNANLQQNFRATMLHCYGTDPKHPVILVVDECDLVQNKLGLKEELEAPLMRGAPDCSVWCLIQRGFYMSQYCYNSQEWLLLYFDPDERNQKRYGEIGGVDPRWIAHTVSNLKTKRGDDGKSTISEALCIRRSGPECFIIDTD
jgi:hypothetical protein